MKSGKLLAVVPFCTRLSLAMVSWKPEDAAALVLTESARPCFPRGAWARSDALLPTERLLRVAGATEALRQGR